MVAFLEVISGVLWPILVIIIILIFRSSLTKILEHLAKRMETVTSIKTFLGEIRFQEDLEMAAADKVFQKEEVSKLLSRAATYGKNPNEVASAIMALVNNKAIAIDKEAKFIIDNVGSAQ